MQRMWWLSLALACGDETPVADIAALTETAETALGEHAAHSGSIGYELRGHGNTFYSTHFDEGCIEAEECFDKSGDAQEKCFDEQGLGWIESEGAILQGEKTAYFGPNYNAQQYITATTDDGYCLYMGENLSLNLVSVEEDSEGRELEANPVTFTWSIAVSEPSPYFECLADWVKNPTLTLQPNQAFAEPEIMGLFDNGCQELDEPMPQPYDRDKAAGALRLASSPPPAPTVDDISALMKDMDKALADRDLDAALELTQCYNLIILDPELPGMDEEWMPVVEQDAVGACIPSDLLDTGPAFADAENDWLVPWLEFHIDSTAGIGRIYLERGDKSRSFYHVELAGTEPAAHLPDFGLRKGNKSVTVQWVDGSWKLVGLIESDLSGITPVRYVNDLHGEVIVPMKPPIGVKNYWEWRVPHWFVFWDRLHGAPMDHQGCPLRRKGGGSDCTAEALAAFNKDKRHQRTGR